MTLLRPFLACLAVLLLPFLPAAAAGAAPPPFGGVPQSIVVRTTENVTEGGWVWILNKAKETGVSRIYLLVKQDENGFVSKRTGRTLRSGELLVSLPDESTAEGWQNSDWLKEMLARAKAEGIEVFAWWPLFNDAVAGEVFPGHAYAGPGGEVFLDPAVAAVRDRQEALLEKLLAAYPFDGVALDWIRYNSRLDGGKGPLAGRFETVTGKVWSAEAMNEPALRAVWDELRAATIADWTRALVATARHQRPAIKWGAFVLPWQFKEVAQSYRRLGDAGLDDLQPMIYWADWQEGPEFTAGVLSGGGYWLKGNTHFRPAFDLNASEEDTLKALGELSPSRLAGLTWYLHEDWTEARFDRLKEFGAAWENAGAPVFGTGEEAGLDPPPPPAKRMGQRLEPFRFAPDASVWAVVCLAELYRLGALDETRPVVPVLALHRFIKGDLEQAPNLWFNTTAYSERLLEFIKASGFSVVPLSRLEAYMVSEDPAILPQRPLTLTIDDGSLSILELFHPIAEKRAMPYAVSLVTSLVKDGGERGAMEDYGIKDPILSAGDVGTLAGSGLVEFVSHSDNLHFWGPEDESGDEQGPAMTTRLWREAEERRESQSEWQARVASDLVRSRVRLSGFGAKGPSILTWPYGEHNGTADDLAAGAGFTSFLNFGSSAFASPAFSNRDIARISVTRADETVPLAMPENKIERQQWWLAFLKWARQSASADLIDAALERLEGEQAQHPEAELSRAAAEALRGHTDAALTRIRTLQKTYPHDGAVHAAVDEVLEAYQQVF